MSSNLKMVYSLFEYPPLASASSTIDRAALGVRRCRPALRWLALAAIVYHPAGCRTAAAESAAVKPLAPTSTSATRDEHSFDECRDAFSRKEAAGSDQRGSSQLAKRETSVEEGARPDWAWSPTVVAH